MVALESELYKCQQKCLLHKCIFAIFKDTKSAMIQNFIDYIDFIDYMLYVILLVH